VVDEHHPCCGGSEFLEGFSQQRFGLARSTALLQSRGERRSDTLSGARASARSSCSTARSGCPLAS
jgi:hypothetical protein